MDHLRPIGRCITIGIYRLMTTPPTWVDDPTVHHGVYELDCLVAFLKKVNDQLRSSFLGWRFGPLSQDVTYSEGVFENEHVASDMENLTNHV